MEGYWLRVVIINIILILSIRERTQAEDQFSISCPTDRITLIPVGETMATVYWSEPQVTGGSGQVTVTSSISSASSFELGDTTVMYSAVDENGNEVNCTFVVTVKAPTIYGCPDQTIVKDNEPGLDDAVVTWVEPRIQDASSTTSLTSDIKSGSRFVIGETTVTYTLTDISTNVETCEFIVQVVDVEPPTFTSCPDNITSRVLAESACNTSSPQWTEPTATDNDGTPTISTSHSTGSGFDCGSTAVNITATDRSGLVGYCIFNVIIQVGAYENCPSNITGVNSPGMFSGMVNWTRPTIIDQDPSWEEQVNPEPDHEFFVGTTNVTYVLHDRSGAADICWFTVTIKDIEDPIIECPADIVVLASSRDGRANVIWPDPFTTDNVHVNVRWSNYDIGDDFTLGDTVVIYGVNDTAGNTGFCNFTVTVQEFVLTLFTKIDGHILVENDDVVINASSIVECLDACIDEETFKCRSAEYTLSGECRLSANIARTFDDLEHQDDVTYYEKVGDNTPPTFWLCPDDVSRPADEGYPFTVISWFRPLANDDRGGPITMTSSHQPGDVFYIGSTEVVYIAQDESLNWGTCSFIITITDDQIPTIHGCPGQTYGYLHSPDERSTDVSWLVPQPLDNSGNVNLTVSHQPGAIFDRGDTTVVYTAVDPSSNEETCSFTVTVFLIPEKNRIAMEIEIPNLVYSDALADITSEHYKMVDEALQIQIQEAYGKDPNLLDSVITNITMSEDGGVVIQLSLGFLRPTSSDSKRDETKIFFTSLRDEGFIGADVKEIRLINHDDSTTIVDECYFLPCPTGMNCTVENKICVSYCPDNPTYCLHDSYCVKPNGNNIVACLCSEFIYYGTRCELEDQVNEPKTLAIVVGVVWVVILLLLLILCFPVYIRRCKQKKHQYHGSDSELVEPDAYYESDGDDDDDGGKTNPAFINDEGVEVEEEEEEKGNDWLGMIAAMKARAQGDGKSDGTNETINMTTVTDPMLKKEDQAIKQKEMSSNLLNIEVETNMEHGNSLLVQDEPDQCSTVPDVCFAEPSNGSSEQRSVAATVHRNGDGNFTMRSSLGNIQEIEESEEGGLDTRTHKRNSLSNVSDNIDGIY
ncbi:hyalin-like [Lytechinus pictus]|uniref:hyalin-like n=1 Tax=Lytechinus pictus TaxID=7653 RepID=UPI0030B9DBDF